MRENALLGTVMLELINSSQLVKTSDYQAKSFPVFATPDDICQKPFVFSRDLRLTVSEISGTGQGFIECSVITAEPLKNGLLRSYGTKSAVDHYFAWWDRWNRDQVDKLYLGHELLELQVLKYELELTLGRVLLEPAYELVQ